MTAWRWKNKRAVALEWSETANKISLELRVRHHVIKPFGRTS